MTAHAPANLCEVGHAGASLNLVGEIQPDRDHAWWAWWRSGAQEELTRLLREQWNPLGSQDLPAEEYASYATRIGDLLREGVSTEELAAYLEEVRAGALGLERHPEEDRRVAAAVHDWYRDARRGAE